MDRFVNPYIPYDSDEEIYDLMMRQKQLAGSPDREEMKHILSKSRQAGEKQEGGEKLT